jgi:hypothetical protein
MKGRLKKKLQRVKETKSWFFEKIKILTNLYTNQNKEGKDSN